MQSVIRRGRGRGSRGLGARVSGSDARAGGKRAWRRRGGGGGGAEGVCGGGLRWREPPVSGRGRAETRRGAVGREAGGPGRGTWSGPRAAGASSAEGRIRRGADAQLLRSGFSQVCRCRRRPGRGVRPETPSHSMSRAASRGRAPAPSALRAPAPPSECTTGPARPARAQRPCQTPPIPHAAGRP